MNTFLLSNFFSIFKQEKLNTIIELLFLRIIINFTAKYYSLSFSDELIVFIFLTVFLFIVYRIIYKEFFNYIRLVLIYRFIIDILIFLIIYSIYKLNPELFFTITPYFTPSILGSVYLLDMTYFNSIFLRSVQDVPSLIDYTYKYLGRKPIEINVKYEPIRPSLEVTAVKNFNLKIKDVIFFNAKLITFNKFLDMNLKSVDYYRKGLDLLIREVNFHKYILYLLENRTGSIDISHVTTPGQVDISLDLSTDLLSYYWRITYISGLQEYSEIHNKFIRRSALLSDNQGELIIKVKKIIAGTSALITIFYNRMNDSVVCFATTNQKRYLYCVNSNSITSYKLYFGLVFKENVSNITQSTQFTNFFRANIPTLLNKPLPHHLGLR